MLILSNQSIILGIRSPTISDMAIDVHIKDGHSENVHSAICMDGQITVVGEKKKIIQGYLF